MGSSAGEEGKGKRKKYGKEGEWEEGKTGRKKDGITGAS